MGKVAKVLCAGSISVTSSFTKSKIWIQLPHVVYALSPLMRIDVMDPGRQQLHELAHDGRQRRGRA
jgi:hypothetical protein